MFGKQEIIIYMNIVRRFFLVNLLVNCSSFVAWLKSNYPFQRLLILGILYIIFQFAWLCWEQVAEYRDHHGVNSSLEIWKIPFYFSHIFSVCFDTRNDDSAWIRQQGTITLRRVAIFFDICTIWGILPPFHYLFF